MARFSLALVAGLALVGFMNSTARCDCGCGGGEPGPACGCASGGCGECGCPEPYCGDHTCNDCGWGWLFPRRCASQWQRWRPCDGCGCGGCESCGCESCGRSCGFRVEHECGCRESCGCESCGCGRESCGCGCESCGCESCGCGCGRCGFPLFPNLFPWLRCERCKGAGERYSCGSQCGCGDLYLGDWRSQPPRCEPCNCCGDWVGPGEPRPCYQMPPRVGSNYNYGRVAPASYEGTPGEGMPEAAPSMPTSPPPTTLPPSAPPAETQFHTTQRPNWSAY